MRGGMQRNPDGSSPLRREVENSLAPWSAAAAVSAKEAPRLAGESYEVKPVCNAAGGRA